MLAVPRVNRKPKVLHIQCIYIYIHTRIYTYDIFFICDPAAHVQGSPTSRSSKPCSFQDLSLAFAKELLMTIVSAPCRICRVLDSWIGSRSATCVQNQSQTLMPGGVSGFHVSLVSHQKRENRIGHLAPFGKIARPPGEDWLSVSLALPAAAAASAAASAEPAEPPPGLRELQRRSEATRRLVVQKGGEALGRGLGAGDWELKHGWPMRFGSIRFFDSTRAEAIRPIRFDQLARLRGHN